MEQPKFLEGLESVLQVIPTGSKYICDPPVLDTDEDWAILIDPLLEHSFNTAAIAAGYERTNRDYNHIDDDNFMTFRHPNNNLNLIVHRDEEIFDAFAEATFIAKQENLTEKEDRIELFEALRNKVHRRRANERRWSSDHPVNQGWIRRPGTYWFDEAPTLPMENDFWYDPRNNTVAGENNN